MDKKIVEDGLIRAREIFNKVLEDRFATTEKKDRARHHLQVINQYFKTIGKNK